MRASVICSKLGLGFVHNFQETTYMKPTFCDNCSGFVSKLYKTEQLVFNSMTKLGDFLCFVASINKFSFLHIFSYGVSSNKDIDAGVGFICFICLVSLHHVYLWLTVMFRNTERCMHFCSGEQVR